MELLPELFDLIFAYTNISSIRIFCQTNKNFFELGQKYIKEKKPKYLPFMIDSYTNIEKFTIELGLDGFDSFIVFGWYCLEIYFF